MLERACIIAGAGLSTSISVFAYNSIAFSCMSYALQFGDPTKACFLLEERALAMVHKLPFRAFKSLDYHHFDAIGLWSVHSLAHVSRSCKMRVYLDQRRLIDDLCNM
eukprot:9388179-Karenia_brevis.AAC.1